MENLNLKCSESIQLDKILSLPGIFPHDPIRFQGRDVRVDFDNLRYKDTPVMLAGQMVGIIPKIAIQTSGSRVRASHGKFTSKNFAGFIGQQIRTGAILEPLTFDGDVVTQARLKAFTVEPASKQDRSGSPFLPVGTTDDEQIAESLFQASGGGPSPVASDDENHSPVKRQGAPTTTYGTSANDDEAIAEMIFISSRGQSAAPDHVAPKRPERESHFVDSGFGNTQNDDIDDDALAEQLFQSGGGA